MYHIALFAHITGALIYFIGVGLDLVVLRGLRQARNVEPVRVWLQIARGIHRLFQLSTALIFIAGIYMALTVWGFWTPWIDVALVALLAFSAIGPLVNGRRFQAIGQTLGALMASGGIASGTEITAELQARIHDPVLRISIHVMASTALGVVFLMTIKPDLLGSLATMVVAAATGWLTTLPHGEQQSHHTAAAASAHP